MTTVRAFLDSCVFYPFSLRDILIQFSVSGMYQAKWSSLVREQVIRNIEADHPRLRGRLDRTFDLMENAIPDFESEPSEKSIRLVMNSKLEALPSCELD